MVLGEFLTVKTLSLGAALIGYRETDRGIRDPRRRNPGLTSV